jgi:hypothetical protein
MTDKEIETYYTTHKPKPQFFSYDTLGQKIFYAFANAKADSLPLLILTHGAPGAWYGYLEYLEDSFLLKHFRIISVDRPGYGKSSKKSPVVSIEEQAKLLSPLLSLSKNLLGQGIFSLIIAIFTKSFVFQPPAEQTLPECFNLLSADSILLNESKPPTDLPRNVITFCLPFIP